ncbi:MAG: O-antigen polymerase [Cetobacterium sp.]
MLLNPIFIFNFIWILVLILTLSLEKILGPITNLLILTIVTGNLVFTVGAKLISKLKIKEREQKIINKKSLRILKVLIVLQIIVGVVIFLKTKHIPFNKNWLFYLRYEMLYEGLNYGGIEYVMLLMTNLSIYLYVLYTNEIIKSKIIYIYIILGLIYVLLMTNRLNLVLYFINIFVIYSLKNKVKIKNILILSGVSISIFYFIGKITNKMPDFKNVFISYFLMGLKYFDYILNSNYELDYGKFSFQLFQNILIKLKIIPIKPNLNVISEENGYFIINESLLTNVPTMYGRLIKDFGIVYVYFIIFIMGILSMLVYKRAQKKETLYIYLYSFIVGMLVFSFFDEMFFRVISYWIQTIVMGFIFEKIFLKKLSEIKEEKI